MFTAEVYFEKQLSNAAVYNQYENALADVVSGNTYHLYKNVPKKAMAETDFKSPKVALIKLEGANYEYVHVYEYPSGIKVRISRTTVVDALG